MSGPQPWLVTAYVEGPSLADAVRNFGPLGPGPVLSLAAGLAEGLEVIHAAGVVHRDLKPSNILLAGDGPRIIDFGISRAAELPGVTRTGWVTGSPSYMSPEQAESGVAGPASDVFSLGSVLAFAATGREPFGSGNGPTVLYRVVHGQPDIDGIPEPLRSLVTRCLAKDPAGRPAAGQVVAELGSTRFPAAGAPANFMPYQPTMTALRSLPGGTAGFAVPQPSPARGAWPPPPAQSTYRQRGARRDRRGSGLAWAAVAAVAVVVAGGVTALALTRHAVPVSQSPNAVPAVSSSGTEGSAAPTADLATSATEWVTYTDPSGFSIKLPPGWSAASTEQDEVRFTGSLPGYVILVEWTSTPKADAYTDWEQQAAHKAATDPTYRQIGIQRVSYRGWNTADWEFTNYYDGENVRVLDRGFVVTPGTLGYAIEIFGPPGGFAAARAALWTGLTSSFEPAGE